jgi:hypothetical protein
MTLNHISSEAKKPQNEKQFNLSRFVSPARAQSISKAGKKVGAHRNNFHWETIPIDLSASKFIKRFENAHHCRGIEIH